MTEKNYYALFDKPTPQNLEANQRGRLTPEQQSALEQMMKNQRAMVMFWGAMTLAVVGFMVFFFWQVAGDDGLFSTPSILAIGVVVVGVVLLIVSLSGGDIMFSLSSDDIENGQVESIIGKVIWTGRRYRTVSDSRKLKSLQYGRMLPPPGDYRFYCLPQSGLVIMAEELGLMSASQPKELLLDALARAHHFSMDDLQANREGSLTGGQEVKLLGYVLLFGMFIPVFVVGIVVMLSQLQLDGKPVIYFLNGMFVILLVLVMGQGIIKTTMDIWGGKAEHADGRVTRHVHRSRNARSYSYQLNNIRFRVSQSAYNALVEGREYRVYFVPKSKRLVAIEPL